MLSDREPFPECTVELNAPLMSKLISELMNDSGDQVLNLCGIAGSGKTTLAKQLCHDNRVRDWFNHNILFVSMGSKIESDGYLAKQLQDKLRENGNKAVMLVLDDVEPGSEKLVEQCRSQISANPKSKILVISGVELRVLGPKEHMKLLGEDDAVTLLGHFAQPTGTSSYNFPHHHILRQVARGCGGLPLAIRLIGSELRGKPIEFWQMLSEQWSKQGHNILHTHSELLTHLQNSLSVLEDYDSIREFFTDLGLFPKGEMIPVTALIDMWVELHKIDVIEAMIHIHRLTALNLADMVVRRQIASDADNYCDHHFLTQSNLLKELANKYSSDQPEVFERKRLIIEIKGNVPPEWWPQQPQLPMLKGSTQQRVAARVLSISTDQKDTPNWCNIQAAQSEVLVLNLHTREYTLPEFIKTMRNLKVLIVTHYGFQFSELKNLELLSFLSELKRIRLQNLSVPCLGKLETVSKLSLYMCEVKAFEFANWDLQYSRSKSMQNLVELNIEYCKDLVNLPPGTCNIVALKKLSIGNCHKFIGLPEEIGNLENLELLRISCCVVFKEMPESITKLKRLSFLDISQCISLRELPDKIGELQNLRKLYMAGCPIRELPNSIMDIEHLERVICDEDAYPLWEVFKCSGRRSNVGIEIANTDMNLNWLSGLGS